MNDDTPITSAAVAAAILTQSPTTYFALTGSGGVSATDQGSATSALTEVGSITKAEDGWQLASGAFLEVPHSTAFETDTGLTDAWVDSEVAVRLDFRVPSLERDIPLASKGNGGRFDGSWWVDITADGSVRWVNAQQKKQVDVFAPPGTISPNVWYAMVLLFGRRGVQMFINANSCEDGFPRPLCWEGWDHRYRGAITTDPISGAVINGARWVNQFPLRIGHNGFGASGEVHVRHFAVFVSGDTHTNPWVRTGTRFTQADIEAVSGVSATAPYKSVHHQGSTIKVETADNIHTQFASARAGDTLELAAGTHKPTGDLTIPSGVRITGAGKSSTTIAFPTGFSMVSDAGVWTPGPDPGGDLAQGATSWTVGAGHGFEADDILVLVTNINHETDISGGNGTISDAMMRSQMVELRDTGETTLSFRQPIYHTFKAANRTSVHRLRPGIKHTYIDNLTITTNGNAVDFAGVKLFGGVDIRLRNVDIRQTNTDFDRTCIRIDSVLSLEALDSDFLTEANDELSAPNHHHPYCVSLGSGGSHVLMNCQADTEGWQGAIDRHFSNSGRETGNKKGPTAQIANVGIVTVDCRFNRRNNNFFKT